MAEIAKPADLEARVSKYERQAQNSGVDPKRIRIYAQILVAAEEHAAKTETIRKRFETYQYQIAGLEHFGLTHDGNKDRVFTKNSYRKGRHGSATLRSSAGATRDRLETFRKTYKKYMPDLPVPLQDRFPFPTNEFNAVMAWLREFITATKPKPDHFKAKLAKSEFDLTAHTQAKLTGHTQALIWWCSVAVPDYETKPEDISKLAAIWGLAKTDEDDIESVPRRIRKAIQKLPKDPGGAAVSIGCPPWATL